MYQTIDFVKQVYSSLKNSIKWQTQLDEFDIVIFGFLITFILHFILNRIRLPSRDYNQSHWSFFKSQLFMSLINYCPGVSSFLEKKKEEALKSFSHSLDKHTTNKTFKIPENGMGYDTIDQKIISM